VTLAHFWLPILVAGVGVFIASSLIHMVLKWHNSDYRKLANEDDVRATLGRGNPSPGQYVVPHCMDMKQMQSPEMQKKFIDGPVGFVIIRPSGLPKMGGHLLKWFLLNLLIAAFAAHLALPAVGMGPMGLFHATAMATFIAYAAGSISDAIWAGRPWIAVGKDLADALIYAIVTGLVFAWLGH